MNLHRRVEAKPLSADAEANIARIQQIWAECHTRYGSIGPYLFGEFSAADAMYAPVVHRFLTYAIELTEPARAYVAAMQAQPAFRQWTQEALAETLLIPRFEQD